MGIKIAVSMPTLYLVEGGGVDATENEDGEERPIGENGDTEIQHKLDYIDDKQDVEPKCSEIDCINDQKQKECGEETHDDVDYEGKSPGKTECGGKRQGKVDCGENKGYANVGNEDVEESKNLLQYGE